MSVEIFEELSTSLINLDENRYISVLSGLSISITELQTPEANNSTLNIVLHELSLNIAKEEHLLSFFTQICSLVSFIQYESSTHLLRILVDQKNNDGKTPLHLAIMTGRKVIQT